MTEEIKLISRTLSKLDKYGREEITEDVRLVLCEVDSITQSEYYQAATNNLKPEYKFTVFFGDYKGEELLTYKDIYYSIYRTYRTGDYMELYAERKAGTAKALK